MKKKVILIAAIASLILLVTNIAHNVLVLRQLGEAVAITIVGGADGVTSIYVTDKSILKIVVALSVQTIATVVLFVWWFRLRRKI